MVANPQLVKSNSKRNCTTEENYLKQFDLLTPKSKQVN